MLTNTRSSGTDPEVLGVYKPSKHAGNILMHFINCDLMPEPISLHFDNDSG